MHLKIRCDGESNILKLNKAQVDYGGVWDCSAPRFSASLHIFLPNGFSSMHSVREKKVEL